MPRAHRQFGVENTVYRVISSLHGLDELVSKDHFSNIPKTGRRPWTLQHQNALPPDIPPARWSQRARPRKFIGSAAVPNWCSSSPRTTSPPATAPSTTSSPTRAGWPRRPPATCSVCSKPAACRSASPSRTAPSRSWRRNARCCLTRWWCGAKRTAPTSSAIRISPRANCSRNCSSSSISRPRTRTGRASRWSATTR